MEQPPGFRPENGDSFEIGEKLNNVCEWLTRCPSDVSSQSELFDDDGNSSNASRRGSSEEEERKRIENLVESLKRAQTEIR